MSQFRKSSLTPSQLNHSFERRLAVRASRIHTDARVDLQHERESCRCEQVRILLPRALAAGVDGQHVHVPDALPIGTRTIRKDRLEIWSARMR